MQTSTKGLALIKEEEGFVAHPYNDGFGFMTVAYGHKITPTDNFPAVITRSQAENILHEDVAHVEWFLNKFLEELHASVNQDQFDALVDFGFNLGTGALHKLLSHGIKNIPAQIMLWTHAGGKVVQDLVERRKKELALWIGTNIDESTKTK